MVRLDAVQRTDRMGLPVHLGKGGGDLHQQHVYHQYRYAAPVQPT